jgi:hypothetical protein
MPFSKMALRLVVHHDTISLYKMHPCLGPSTFGNNFFLQLVVTFRKLAAPMLGLQSAPGLWKIAHQSHIAFGCRCSAKDSQFFFAASKFCEQISAVSKVFEQILALGKFDFCDQFFFTVSKFSSL